MSNVNPTSTPPANTEPDGRVYSLEHSYPMDTGEVVGGELRLPIDIDGAIVWSPAAKITEVPEHVPMTGTYAEVSEKAVSLNALQIRLYGEVQHVFSAAPLEPMAA